MVRNNKNGKFNLRNYFFIVATARIKNKYPTYYKNAIDFFINESITKNKIIRKWIK
jgi:hypothetical protein